jgi:hypothetical protein
LLYGESMNFFFFLFLCYYLIIFLIFFLFFLFFYFFLFILSDFLFFLSSQLSHHPIFCEHLRLSGVIHACLNNVPTIVLISKEMIFLVFSILNNLVSILNILPYEYVNVWLGLKKKNRGGRKKGRRRL